MKVKILALSIICLFAFGCGGPVEERARPAAHDPVVQKPENLEYMLATIEKGYVSKDDIIIARFKSLLEQLDAKFAENKTQISDISVGSRELLIKEGIQESLLNIMEGMNRIFYTDSTTRKYAETVPAYMVLRTKGMSHAEAIEGLRGLLQ